jgi:hypothetical protein
MQQVPAPGLADRQLTIGTEEGLQPSAEPGEPDDEGARTQGERSGQP